MKTAIKVIMAVLLMICLAKMPYGYFQFIRLACCAGFIYLAVQEFKAGKQITGVLSVAGAILFNPIFKIYLTRATWTTLDVIIAVLLIIQAVIEFASAKKASQ
jgi:hypothetical protein